MAGTEVGFRFPDSGSLGEAIAAKILPAGAISFTPNALTADASAGDAVGTPSLDFSYEGTPVWSLADAAAGSFAIDPSTGAITVADTLFEGDFDIQVQVRGIKPHVFSPVFTIAIASGGGGGANTLTLNGVTLQLNGQDLTLGA